MILTGLFGVVESSEAFELTRVPRTRLGRSSTDSNRAMHDWQYARPTT